MSAPRVTAAYAVGKLIGMPDFTPARRLTGTRSAADNPGGAG
jgi:hypothetical protein